MTPGIAGKLPGALHGPVQPAGAGEISSHVAGPPPRLDGHAAIEQIQVRGHGAEFHRQAKGPARPVPQQAGDADIARHAQRGRARLQLAGSSQGRLCLPSRQRQAPADEQVLELQPPPEDQVAVQQRPGLRKPRIRTIGVPDIQALFREILQRGDSYLRGPLA